MLALNALRRNNMPVPNVRVAVLRGGFDQWVRRFWKNATLVQGYDDEYWGYAELEAMRASKTTKNDGMDPHLPFPTPTGSSLGAAQPSPKHQVGKRHVSWWRWEMEECELGCGERVETMWIASGSKENIQHPRS